MAPASSKLASVLMSQRQVVRMPWARPPGRYVPAARSGVRMRVADRNLPRTPKEIQQYCRKALRSELLQEEFDIMRACLLVALEEEAALSVHQSIIFENLRAQGEDVSEAVASINSKMSSAVRSQFNTARIDSLADLVLHAFVQQLDLPLQSDSPSRSSQRDPGFTSPSSNTSSRSSNDAAAPREASPAEPASASTPPETTQYPQRPNHPKSPQSQSTPEAATRPEPDTPQSGTSDTPQASQISESVDSASSAPRSLPVNNESSIDDSPTTDRASLESIPEASALESSAEEPKDSNSSEDSEDDDGVEYRMPLIGGVRRGVLPGYPPQAHTLGGMPDLEPLQRPQRVRHLAEHPALQPLLKSHTALFLHVASDVLFNLQGYRQPLKEGKKRASMDAFLMNSVLETGVGAPIVLAILFRAVCHRAGVRVNLSVLDGGSDCVVWPEGSTGGSGIKVSGHTLVLDIFSRGAVMLEAEVKEFFNVESLSPSSDRDLLFALLSGLQDCNWRLAVDRNDVWSRHSVAQCLQAALQPVTAVKEPYHLSRAVAAAERCLLVKPQHLELHVYAAALCFLDQNLHRCQQHLQLVYGGLDALGMQCATGYMDRTSRSNDEEYDSDDLETCDGGSEGDSTSRAKLPKGPHKPPSVFAVRRNVSIEDVCLLQRPRWQGGVARPGSDAAHMQETLALMGVQIGATGGDFGVPEVRVVKRGSSRKDHAGNDADASGPQEGEEVVAKLRETEVVLRRPRRCGVSPSDSDVARGSSVQAPGSDPGDSGAQTRVEGGAAEGAASDVDAAASGAAAGAAAGGRSDDRDDMSLEEQAVEFVAGAEGGDGGVWEWSAGSNGELVFVASSGEKVALSLTDQAPLPLDESIMGEVTEDMGLLWHKTVLMQQMGSESSGEY